MDPDRVRCHRSRPGDPRETVGASFGAAFLAASTQVEVDIDDWNPAVGVRRPDPALADAYDAAFALYLDLYPATRDVAHALAERQRRIAEGTAMASDARLAGTTR